MDGISSVSSLNVFQSIQSGISQGLEGLARDAQAIAEANVDGSLVNTTAAMVDSLQQKLLVQLNVNMLKVADKTIGSLLDVTA